MRMLIYHGEPYQEPRQAMMELALAVVSAQGVFAHSGISASSTGA